MASNTSPVVRRGLARAAARLTALLCHVTAIQCAVIAAGSMLAVAGRAPGQDIVAEYELEMYSDPPLTSPKIVNEYPPGMRELWLRALERPDAELQRVVIDSIVIAHRRGVEGMKETVPRLVTLLAKPNQPLDVTRAAAAALVELGVEDQAASLAAIASRQGPSLAQIVEPALADWKSPVMKQAWLDRVKTGSAGQSMMLLAINGLAALRTTQAIDSLKLLMQTQGQRIPIRLAAARALGAIRGDDATTLAAATLGDQTIPLQLRSLLAVNLLSHRDDLRSIGLLKQILDFDDSTLQAQALGRLYEIDPAMVDGMTHRFLTSADVNVRRWCVRAMIDLRRVEQVAPLCRILDDVNPSLRRRAAAGLVDLAESDELREAVTTESMKVLMLDRWRGCEQAAKVLAKLDHKPSGDRMLELLGHPRGEVQVASAWGLKRLQIDDLLPEMLEHAESVYEGFRSGQLSTAMHGRSLKMAHLFEAFGRQSYLPANTLMRKYVPKDFSLGAHSRPAAAWALGLIYEGSPQEDLVNLFRGRLRDSTGAFPETRPMRGICAVALGRMRAESAVRVLRTYAGGASGVGQRCSWALQQITGEPVPKLEPLTVSIDDWLLAPIE